MENFDNHIEETVSETTEVQQETIEPIGESVPQEEPRGIKVKYDKEEKFIPDEEVQNWVQKGLYYENKVQNKLSDYEQKVTYLDKLAQMQGYNSTDEFLQAVNEYEQQKTQNEQIQQEISKYEHYANQYGVDQETFREMMQNMFKEMVLPYRQENQQTKQETENLRNELFSFQVEREMNKLKSKYGDIDENLIIDTAREFRIPPDKLEAAYKLATYDSLGPKAEQEAIKKLQHNAVSTPGSLSESAETPKLNVGSMSKEQFEDMIARVKRGERINL